MENIRLEMPFVVNKLSNGQCSTYVETTTEYSTEAKLADLNKINRNLIRDVLSIYDNDYIMFGYNNAMKPHS